MLFKQSILNCLKANINLTNNLKINLRLINNHQNLIKRIMSSEVEKAQTAKPEADTIFGKITRGEIPTKFLYEDDLCIAIDDISPVAPVHFLVIPKKPIVQLSKSEDADEQILGRLLSVARKVAVQKGISENGYRTVINDGKHGCQSVYHIHVHVIGGKQLGWPPC